MMNGVSIGLLAVAALVPTLGQAQQPTPLPELSYNYAELSYDEGDFELEGVGGIDGDGLTLSGSFELTEDWHAYASFTNSDLDSSIDVDTWALGAGYRYPLQDNVDIYGRVLYIDREVDGPGPFAADADDDGLGLQARIRMRVSEVFEVEGGIQHLDVGDSDTALQASARYHFTRNFSAGIGLTFAGDTDSLGINARYTF